MFVLNEVGEVVSVVVVLFDFGVVGVEDLVVEVDVGVVWGFDD